MQDEIEYFLRRFTSFQSSFAHICLQGMFQYRFTAKKDQFIFLAYYFSPCGAKNNMQGI